RFALSAEAEPAGAGPDQAGNAAGRRTLLIGAVTTAAGYDGRALVYRLGPDRYESDFYNEFLAPPARLLADAETERLTRTSRRLRVTTTPGLALAEFGLETRLEALYGDYTRTPPQAVLTLRFTLNDLRPVATRVVLDRTYPCLRPLAEETPSGLVAAFRLCLADTLDELALDLDRLI
ncbi:MAG: PqiC family protein, partial [Candidatus Adiutrix sp.]|nr:PqiC family protein [Candidatus Adiutrix sp.]